MEDKLDKTAILNLFQMHFYQYDGDFSRYRNYAHIIDNIKRDLFTLGFYEDCDIRIDDLKYMVDIRIGVIHTSISDIYLSILKNDLIYGYRVKLRGKLIDEILEDE